MPEAPARQAGRAGTPERDSAESQYRGENLRPARTWLRLPPCCFLASLLRAPRGRRSIGNCLFGVRRFCRRSAGCLVLPPVLPGVASGISIEACRREAVRVEWLR